MFFTEMAHHKRDFSETSVTTNVGNGTDNFPDYAIIQKDRTHGVIIIKLKNELGCFDYTDFISAERYTILNYKVLESSGEAYEKMMKWIGKMCAKPSSSRYFNKYNPYENPELNDKLFNKALISKIKKDIK